MHDQENNTTAQYQQSIASLRALQANVIQEQTTAMQQLKEMCTKDLIKIQKLSATVYHEVQQNIHPHSGFSLFKPQPEWLDTLDEELDTVEHRFH